MISRLGVAALALTGTGLICEAMAQPTASETDAARRARITERLSGLNRNKLEALLDRIGAKTPNGFYDCLCSGRWHASHVAVRYDAAKGMCHFSGFGEWDEPLPNSAEAWKYCIADKRYPDGKTLVDAIAGAVDDLNKTRPTEVGAKPTGGSPTAEIVPDPKACGKDDANHLERVRLYTQLEMAGRHTAGIKRFDAAIRRAITRLDQPGALPTWWQSLGFSAPPADSRASRQAWCEAMLSRFDNTLLSLLKEGNPERIASTLRRYAHALGQFDRAMQEETEAAIDIIAADQKEVEAIISLLPPGGLALDALAAANWMSGNKDIGLTGETITTTDMLIRFAATLGPEALGRYLQRSPNAHLIAEGLSEMGHSLGTSAKTAAVHILGGSEGRLVKGLEAIKAALLAERSALVSEAKGKSGAAIGKFLGTADGAADKAIFEADIRAANEALENMRKLRPGTPEWSEAVRRFQTNKTAQRLVNTEAFDDQFRRDINRTTQEWYDAAHRRTANDVRAALNASDGELSEMARRMCATTDPRDIAKLEEAMKRARAEAKAFADRHGVPVSSLEVRAKTITNTRPGAKTKTTVTRDHDATIEMVAPGGATRDIDHAVSTDPYYRNFHTATGASNDVIQRHGLRQWAHERMDQTVTSWGHGEAYNPGEVPLKDFLDKGVKPTVTRVDDVADTIAHKSLEWFERDGAHAIERSRNTVEGMRQAVKQWDDLIMSRAAQYGAAANVPPRLEAALDLFRQAQNGKLSAAQVEKGLASLSHKVGNVTTPYTKEAAVADMANFFKSMEKGPGAAFRVTEGARIAQAVRAMAATKSGAWQDSAIATLNNALRDGRISGESFLKLRSEVISQTASAMPHGRFTEWARSAQARGLINAAEAAGASGTP